MTFVGCFHDPRSHQLDDSHKDLLLRNLTDCLRFPPAVRSMYSLLNRHIPTFEDRAALLQCLYKHAERIYEGPKSEFTLRESRGYFGQLLHETTSVSDPRSSFPFLEAFTTLSLEQEFPGTDMSSGIVFQADGRRIILERHVAEYYQSGSLRKTLYNSISTNESSPILERLRAYLGRRTDQITYCRNSALFALNEASIEPQTTSKLPIIAPADLFQVSPPALTRDETGGISVYLGDDPCAVPPEMSLLCSHVSNLRTTIFRPSHGEQLVDRSKLTQTLERLREKRADTNFEFETAEGREDNQGRSPSEVVMVCLDASQSMGDPAFPSKYRKGNELQGVRELGELSTDI